MAEKLDTEFDRFNSLYEMLISRTAFLILGVLLAFAVLAVTSFFTRGNDLLLSPFNKTSQEVLFLEVALPDLTVRIPGSRIHWDGGDTIRLPVDEPTTYTLTVQLEDGRQIEASSRSVNPGCRVYEKIYEDRIEHLLRSCY